jgi:hypothetical protein
MPRDPRSPKGIMMLRTSPPFPIVVGKRCVNTAGVRQMPVVFIRLCAYGICEACTSGDSIPRNCSQLSSLSPAAKCHHDDGPCHQECSKSHADGEEKHGHQVEILHIPDNVPCLQNGVSKYHIGEDTNQLTLAMKMRPPETRQKDDTSSDGGREAKTEVGGERKNKI